jgi:hypothetical protein
VPERLDRVIVSYSGGSVVIPRASRDELVDQLSPPEGDQADRGHILEHQRLPAVALTREHEARLYNLLEHWLNEVGIERMPEGVAGSPCRARGRVHDRPDPDE